MYSSLFSLKTLSISFLLTITLWIPASYAWSCFWNWADPSCKSWEIQYCANGSCTLNNGLTVVDKASLGLFTKKTIAQYSQDVVKYFLGFVTLIGVIYVIYAGFQIMTGAWDDEKMKKARQIIIYVLVGIIIMWLAYAIVDLIIKAATTTGTRTS